MNQILSVDNSNKPKREKNYNRTTGPLEINTILKFFSVALIIFGVLMISTGSYSMYQSSKDMASQTKPPIFVEETSESELTIKINHKKPLSKVTYKWNNDEEVEIEVNNKKNIEQKIQIPTGTNILNIYAKDINGQETRYQKEYNLQGDITIDFEPEGNKIKISVEGKEDISYITYRWDEEEETKVDINDKTAEEIVEIPKGEHTITVVAVDANNETETKEQKVKGVTKPKLEVTTDGSDNFVINASDEQGLKKVEFIINETEKFRISLDGRTELEYAYPLHDGENKLEVTVYNENDVTETFRAKVTK